MKRVAIVGAGASGLLCAIQSARDGLRVDIFEQNTKCAKKILVSGNGRCNITNTSFSSSDYFGENILFTDYALKNFDFVKFQRFCGSIGLELDIKEDAKVYPLSNEAKSVASLLQNKAKSLGVKFYTEHRITDIKTLQDSYDAVVIATGSEAASHLGGNRDGLDFASALGHTIIPTYPSLVQLELEGKSFTKMSGSKVDGEVSLLVNNVKSNTSAGDILFTDYGVSGFAILDISELASKSLRDFQAVDISINLLPRFTAQKLSAHIMKMVSIDPTISILDLLHGLLPLKIAKTIVEELDFTSTMQIAQINTKLSKKISNKILNWKFEVRSTHGFRHAEVSGGGVATNEIDPTSMESLKEKNVYFIGEVLDVVGRRGGFNFAWAWASAYVCAKSLK